MTAFVSWFLGAASGMSDCHENGSAGILPATSSNARCPATAGRMPALPGFSCTVVSRRIMKSSLGMTPGWRFGAWQGRIFPHFLRLSKGFDPD
jgi:hypothetical protein